MDQQQLFIPDKLKVGFQNRGDTYTKKLAYVIYFDHKGVLRKEKSWQSWRDNKIAAVEYANEPTEGFVLNKGVGGTKYGWNTRSEYIRVYDPRDFEFEISVANLLFILRECDCSKGKGLEGKFVYAWHGTELVLLPEVSQDYQSSKAFTQLQNQGVKSKDLIAGATYITKRQEYLVYLGKFDYHFFGQRYETNKAAGLCKRFVFCKDDKFLAFDNVKNIAAVHLDTVVSNYASLVDKYNKSFRGSKVSKLFLKPASKAKDVYGRDYWYYERLPGVFVEATSNYKDWQAKKDVESISTINRFFIKDGVLTQEQDNKVAYAPGVTKPSHSSWSSRDTYGHPTMDWVEPTASHLWVELESGSKFKLNSYDFRKEK